MYYAEPCCDDCTSSGGNCSPAPQGDDPSSLKCKVCAILTSPITNIAAVAFAAWVVSKYVIR